MKLKDLYYPIKCLVNLDESQIASGSTDETIKIWSLIRGKCIQTFDEHKDRVNSILKLEDNQIISENTDGTMKIQSLNQDSCIKTITSHSASIIASSA